MEKRDIVRLKTSHIVMIIVMVFLSAVLGVIFAVNKYMDSQIAIQKWVRDKAKTSYERTTYVEKNIQQFYEFVEKSRSFSTVSMYDLKKEFAFLIPSTVKITSLELKEDSGKFSGVATDFRTVDFVSNVLKTYSSLYGTISDVTVANSSKTSPTMVTFAISFNVNKDKLKNSIYTEDIDWDGMTDFKEESVNVGWVIENKKVINDECPFTPKFFVIGKMLEQNPTLLDVYPKYRRMYDGGYLTLGENGCLNNWDYNILY